ncbi:MAG: YihY/virulence factor BrkB family protein [Deltaproteobacteria bacterium]|nr:YihY/virulence factor BrkB family protein [Candidatus Anaeroferrophillacea bacterium]
MTPASSGGSTSLRLLRARERLAAWVWREQPQLDWRLNGLRRILRIACILIRELRRDLISLRSSALTFTVVLSLVPMLALGTAVLKGLGAGDQVREAAYRLIGQVAGPSRPLVSDAPAAADPGAAQRDFAGHLRTAVDQVFSYVDRTNFATLGFAGVLILVIAVIMVLGSIEEAMNAIWQARKGRSMGRRILDYLALMMLFPVVVNVGIGTSAALHSPALLGRLHAVIPAWGATLLLRLLPFLILAGIFALLYQFLPNTKVKFSAALTGGIGAAFGLLAVEKVYLSLQIGVARYNAIYGSFATVPLFLLWIHLGWIVFLAGAELAFAVQVQHRYRPEVESDTPVARLATAFDIMATIRDDFHRREPTRVAGLAGRIGAGEQPIHEIVEQLLDAGLLRQVENGGDMLVSPAGPPDELPVDMVIAAIWGTGETPATPGGRLAADLLRAAGNAAGHAPLAAIFSASGGSIQGAVSRGQKPGGRNQEAGIEERRSEIADRR